MNALAVTGDPMRHANGSLHSAPLSSDAVLRIVNGRVKRGTLTRDTTVWDAFDLGRWYYFSNGARRGCLDDVADAWRGLFGIGDAEVDFESVLWPPRQRTMGPVCDLIAAHAVGLQLESPTEDHAFDAVLETLAADGADVAGLTPQFPLEPHLRKHLHAFAGPIFVLARGRIACPDVAYAPSALRTSAILLVAAVAAAACGALGAALLGPVALLVGVGGFFACMAGALLTLWLAHHTGRARWKLGELTTFADLARVIAREHAAD